MMHKALPFEQSEASRSGVTLTEVLMSLMIMAIGVTSVITLFPIAALRSAQATKLTNSAILKYNVEGLLELRPELIFDPNGNLQNPPATTRALQIAAITEHYKTLAQRNYIVDPVGYFSILEYSQNLGVATGSNLADAFGHDAANNPSGIPRFDGGVAAELSRRLGIALNPTTLSPAESSALRIGASQLAGLGDGWDTIYEFIPEDTVPAGGGAPVTGVKIPLDVIPTATDLALVPTSKTLRDSLITGPSPLPLPGIVDPELTRIVVFSVDEDFSESFPLLQVNNVLEATWSEAVTGIDFNLDGYIEPRTLPREFQNQVGKVLIQTRRSVDFNWMLTVRRSADGRARSIDVVVRFGTEPKYESEQAYPVSVNPGQGSRITTIRIDGSAGEPALLKGGFLFDIASARWHRIRNYEEVGTGIFEVTIEKPASTLSGPALLIPGVVEVYPLGSRNIPDELLRGF